MSDGTEGGTTLAYDIVPSAIGSFPTQLKAIGGKLFFSANDGIVGRELWKYVP